MADDEGPLLPLDSAPPRLKWCPNCGHELDKDSIINWGGWSFDEDKNQFVPGTPGSTVHFTRAEGRVLACILRAHGGVVDKEGGLYSAICANRPDCDWPELKIVDVIVCKVRKKLQKNNLSIFDTSWGKGYFAIQYTPDPIFKVSAAQKKIPRSKAVNARHDKRARPCHCGHIAGHHYSSGNGKGRCRVEGCECDKYGY